MFERSVGNATRRVNVTPFYVWTCSENYNLVVRFGIIFIIKTEFCISFSSRKTTKKSIGFAPIFPDICYHLTHYKPAAADIPV
ncbi:hypothetical protein OU674_11370, partial [Escherichia coli]|nr:hypothetical protein [Escherichia coli]